MDRAPARRKAVFSFSAAKDTEFNMSQIFRLFPEYVGCIEVRFVTVSAAVL